MVINDARKNDSYKVGGGAVSSTNESYVIDRGPITSEEARESRARLNEFMAGFTPAPGLVTIMESRREGRQQ